MNHVQ
jgi:hypothetical protein